MKEVKHKTILIPLESYLHLHKLCREQRCHDFEQRKDRLLELWTKNFNKSVMTRNGKHTVCDYDFGGATGNRWTSWSCEQMKSILKEANLPFEDGQEIECIYV